MDTPPQTLEAPAFAILAAVIAIALVRLAWFPAHAPGTWLNYVMDDFFYYLVVAQNIAAGHGSTFNGIVLTNGYHPLWEWTLVGAMRAGFGTHIALFLGLSVALSGAATFLLCTRLLRRGGLGRVASASLAALVLAYALHVLIEGMEVILTLPLLFALLCAVSNVRWWSERGSTAWGRGLLLGLLVAALTLSRLDALLFVLLLLACLLAQRSVRDLVHPPLAVGVLLGSVPPLAGYALFNRLHFGLWAPVSGLAKQLKLDHGFTAAAWRIFFGKSALQTGVLALLVLALLLLPRVWRTLSPVFRALTIASLLFPFLYTATLSWTSDWTLWPWYFYSLRPALCMALLVLARTTLVSRLLERRALVLALAAFSAAAVLLTRWTPAQPDIVRSALRLSAFAQSHPGIYAMGDRAGAVGYLVAQPVVQTEGLMMDRAFLERLRAQQLLRDALTPYGVRFYVISTPVQSTSCIHASEPFQAGPHAPHMEAQFCAEPLAHWNELGIDTFVFQLSDALPAR